MISYGPLGDAVKARIGLTRLIEQRIGVSRAQHIGIVWQNQTECALIKPPIPFPNGHTELMVVQPGHPGHKAKPPVPSDMDIAWDVINVVGDAAFAYMAITEFAAGLAVVAELGLDAVGVGAVCLLAFAAVEVADAFVLFLADGAMTIAKTEAKLTGNQKIEERLKSNDLYNFIETWGPVIALPAVGKDILDFFKLASKARLLTDVRRQTFFKAREVLREMRVADAFIGEEGDAALHESYDILKTRFHKFGHELEDIHRDFNRLRMIGAPSDIIGVVNDYLNWQDITDGIVTDWKNLEAGAMFDLSEAEMQADRWLHSTAGWLRAGSAYAAVASPFQAGSPYAAARFGGMFRTVGNPKVKITHTFPLRIRLLGATHAKPVRGGR